MSNLRPNLSKDTLSSEFESFYWEKKELIQFCKEHGIPSTGGKIDISKRISHFLNTGNIKKTQKSSFTSPPDSSKPITKNTPVVHYKNDAVTREFFQKEIGPKFGFNYYLRQFAKQQNNGSITYGDLVEGYKQSLLAKKPTIDKQFQYNQFTRDYFASEPNPTREGCLQAWKKVRSIKGETTYKHYITLKSF